KNIHITLTSERQKRKNTHLLEQVTKTQKELKKKNTGMREDLELAAEVQESSLPDMPEQDFLKLEVHYAPFGDVSGDTYYIAQNRDQALNIFLGDATGHGVSAAFITMMAQMALRTIRKDQSPSKIIRQLNQEFGECTPGDKFMTAIFLQIHPNGALHACNAGHPPFIIIPSNPKKDILSFRQCGFALGLFPEELRPYPEIRYQLEPKDKIFLYTDGVTEWQNSEGDIFTEERLLECLDENRSRSMKKILEKLIEAVKEFAGETRCEDDLTLLGFKFEATDGS
ncbi:MAG: serine/threonine-protein phosphatase, partial [SAR324 cluster bacterium]|nr:serine/threonine-protein phosphatase [SAR324 cluster bacterium]